MAEYHVRKRKISIKRRKINVEQQIYTYSVTEKEEYIRLLVYDDNRLLFCLRISWTEAWGINLFCPKTVAFIIKYYQNNGFPYSIRFLKDEQSLFLELTDILFDRNEQYEKTIFIKRCQEQI